MPLVECTVHTRTAHPVLAKTFLLSKRYPKSDADSVLVGTRSVGVEAGRTRKLLWWSLAMVGKKLHKQANPDSGECIFLSSSRPCPHAASHAPEGRA